MKKSIGASLAKSIDIFPKNKMFMSIGAIILILPMIATIGQFNSENYFQKTTGILLLFWPGSDLNVSLPMSVLLFMGMVFISYVAGIIFLFQRRTLGKVILLTITAFISAGLIRSVLSVVFGMQESPLPDNLTGKADSILLSEWHNPIWEEIVFRGIPLLILLAVEKYLTKGRTKAGIVLYCTIPAIICGLYHIPGHGFIRFFDTLLLGAFFGWLAIRFTFFAPVVMHYVADAILVFNLYSLPSIQPSEVSWLIQYGRTLGSFFWLLTMILVVLVPVLLFVDFKKQRQLPDPVQYGDMVSMK